MKRLACMILAGLVLAFGVGCEAKVKTPTNTTGGPSVDPAPPTVPDDTGAEKPEKPAKPG